MSKNRITFAMYDEGRCMLPDFAIPSADEAGSFDYANFFNNKYPKPSRLERVKEEESADFVPDPFAIPDEPQSYEDSRNSRSGIRTRRQRQRVQAPTERFVLTPEKPTPQPEDWKKYAQIALPRLPRYTKQYMLQALRNLRDAGYDIGTSLNLSRDSMKRELKKVRAIINEKGREYCPGVIAEIKRNNAERRSDSITQYVRR